VLEAIVAHARAEQPRECCGLLIGAGGVVIEAAATANAADDPVRRFEIPPIEHIRQMKRCRTMTAETGQRHEVIGAYHSHPRSAPEPSPTDLAQAFRDFLYIIAGPADVDEVVTNAYRLTEDGMRPVIMEVC
jgi:proteasome lid subunit RPN8/RPN11